MASETEIPLELPASHGLKIVLVEPEIPQNVGNIARLCAVTGATLHLVRPLGFFLTSKHLKRAGMDYWDQLEIHIHDDLPTLRRQMADSSYWLCSSKGGSLLWNIRFETGSWLVFGKESAGLPADWLASEPARAVRIPMIRGARCLNISTATGIVLFEALRQIQYID
jgi:tRNA (cytidine/uridine-2'-O-)-methyltransferase